MRSISVYILESELDLLKFEVFPSTQPEYGLWLIALTF